MDGQLESSVSNRVLGNLPMGIIVFSDANIHWVNSWLLEKLQTSLDSLVGLSKSESIETDFAALFGSDETLRLTDSDDQIVWLYREKSASDNYEIHYFQDITSLMQVIEERKQLRLEAAVQQIKDPATGLLNEAAILQALDLQVSRSRRYQNPLSVIELSISTKNGTPCDKKQIQSTSNLLKDQLRWADQVGFLNKSTFLILLPETSKTDTQQLIDKLCRAEESPLAPESQITPLFKIEEWVKGDDPRKLLRRLKESSPISNLNS
jgi:GGDEF domain-containing protein